MFMGSINIRGPLIFGNSNMLAGPNYRSQNGAILVKRPVLPSEPRYGDPSYSHVWIIPISRRWLRLHVLLFRF